MQQRLKQRLVGATVIVLAVVIFVPELLDPSRPASDLSQADREAEEERFSSRIVPLETAVSEPETSGPEAGAQPGDLISVSPVVTAVQPRIAPTDGELLSATVPSEVEGGAHDTPKQVPSPIPRSKFPLAVVEAGGETAPVAGWAVQLGSFARSMNAIGLRDRLRAHGYPAFVQPAQGAGGKITRVLVGPELERSRAEAALRKLRAEHQLDGVLVRYPRG